LTQLVSTLLEINSPFTVVLNNNFLLAISVKAMVTVISWKKKKKHVRKNAEAGLGGDLTCRHMVSIV